jgi:hypothetical protein
MALGASPGLEGRAYTPDLPGFGLTPLAPAPLDLDGLADALAAWMQAAGCCPRDGSSSSPAPPHALTYEAPLELVRVVRPFLEEKEQPRNLFERPHP